VVNPKFSIVKFGLKKLCDGRTRHIYRARCAPKN